MSSRGRTVTDQVRALLRFGLIDAAPAPPVQDGFLRGRPRPLASRPPRSGLGETRIDQSPVELRRLQPRWHVFVVIDTCTSRQPFNSYRNSDIDRMNGSPMGRGVWLSTIFSYSLANAAIPVYLEKSLISKGIEHPTRLYT